MTTDLIRELSPIQMDSIEQEIERDRHSFLRMGNNLIRIRDGKGYKLRGFKTFEDYCDRRWGISDRHGRRLIEAAETAEKTQATLGTAPSSESVARELKKVADDPIVLQRVADKLTKKKTTIATATAEQVADVVATVTGKARPEPKVNGSGDKPLGINSKAVKEMGMSDEKPPARDELLLGFVRAAHLYLNLKPPNVAAAQAELDNCVRLLATKSTDSAKVKTCRTCGCVIPPGAAICANCGAIIK